MTRKKSTSEAGEILHHEIEHLAHLNWQRDGRPAGRDLQYWLEAERQLKATKHLLVDEHKQRPDGKAATVKAKPRRVAGTGAQAG